MFKRKNGFTAIELMTVVVIIGILTAMAYTSFIAPSKERALEASLKANIRTLQIMLETYRVDNQVYPMDISELAVEASKKNYNKTVANPFSKQLGLVTIWAIDYLDPTDPLFPPQKKLYEGKVGFQRIDNSKYYLSGYALDGVPIQVNGKVYLITNGG